MVEKTKSKSRMLAFIAVSVLVIVGGSFYALSGKSNIKEAVDDPTKANNVQLDVNVQNIEAIPGKSNDPLVNALQAQKNEEDFKKAKEEGASYIPKLVNNEVVEEEDFLKDLEKELAPEPMKEPDPVVEPTPEPVQEQEPVVEPTPIQEIVPIEQPKVIKKVKPQPNIQYKVEMPQPQVVFDTKDLETTYKKEIEELFRNWDEQQKTEDEKGLMTSEFDYFGQQNDNKGGNGNNANNIGNGYDDIRAQDNGQEGAMFVRSTTIAPGILKTAINTDEPGPVLAEIVDGPLKGARLLGEVTNAPTDVTSPVQKATIQFSKIQLPNGTQEYSVDVYAIDLKTSRTALASSVNNHYFRRYGLGLAAAFIEGLGDAYSRTGTSITTGVTSTTVSNSSNSKDINRSALGKMGKKLSQEIDKISDVPATIYVNADTPIGLLFMADF